MNRRKINRRKRQVPFDKNEVISNSIKAKKVVRLLRTRSSSFPVYKKIQITRSLLQDILKCDNHLTRVSLMGHDLERGQTIDWELINPEESEFIDELVRSMQSGFESDPILDEKFVETVFNILDQVWYSNFLQDIISDEPITADEFHARANAYSALGDVEKALADYTRAIELNPYYPLYWHSLAKFKFAHGVDSAIVLTDLSAALDVSEKDDLLMRFDILFFRAEILKRPAISITVWTA